MKLYTLSSGGGYFLHSVITYIFHDSWWRHQMEIFSALLALCAGNSPVTGEFPSQRPVTRSSDIYFDLRLNKRLCKQSLGWRFETPSRPLWRHCNVLKEWWPIKYHLHIWQVSPQFSSCDTCLIWKCFQGHIRDWYFCNISNIPNKKLTKWFILQIHA